MGGLAIEGWIGATYINPTRGAQAIGWTVRILEQDEVPPKEVVLRTEEVTEENAQQLYGKYTGADAAATPIP